MATLRVGLIGDRDDSVTAHRAIPIALRLAAQQLARPLMDPLADPPAHPVEIDWLATDALPDDAGLACFDAFWCVPASPYRDMARALRAIRFARERRVPFLGTCGGFQHAVIEYARHVLGWPDADHAETAPNAGRVVISALTCSLVEVEDRVLLSPGSRIAEAYAADSTHEGYRCNFGLNPTFADALTDGPLRATAHDSHGEVRAVELDAHPFFVATLFQPERIALRGEAPPLACALLRAAMR